MLDLVRFLNKEMNEAAEEIRKYCTAPEVPLADRWAVALEAKWAFKEETSYIDFNELLGTEVNWYCDFNIERHQTQTLLCDEFVQWVAEATWPEEEREYCAHVKGAKRLTEDEVKEYILQTGYRSFVNDW